jgi:hypothetical protein
VKQGKLELEWHSDVPVELNAKYEVKISQAGAEERTKTGPNIIITRSSIDIKNSSQAIQVKARICTPFKCSLFTNELSVNLAEMI